MAKPTAARRSANLSIDPGALCEARSPGTNLSKVAEASVAVAIARAVQWKRDNRSALESSNSYVEEYGLSLAEHRQF